MTLSLFVLYSLRITDLFIYLLLLFFIYLVQKMFLVYIFGTVFRVHNIFL